MAKLDATTVQVIDRYRAPRFSSMNAMHNQEDSFRVIAFTSQEAVKSVSFMDGGVL